MPVVHFIYFRMRGRGGRETPCERALLHGEPNTMSAREVTCPVCLAHPMYLDLLAQLMEKALAGPVDITKEGIFKEGIFKHEPTR